MHTSKDNYLINTLRIFSAKEATQIYDALLPESLTSHKMKKTKAYKTYLGFATGATPPKIPRKFKKASSSRKDLNLNLGNDKDDNNNDNNSKSDGSDEQNDNDDDNTQSNNEKGSDSGQETDENESGSESDHQENEEELEDDEEEIKDEYTDEGLVQKEGADAEIIKLQHGNENLETTLDQVIEDAHVTINTIAKKTEVSVTSSSHSFDLAAKFLNFADIPTT
nr:hypothetical protein [Tanacetum cinerariifolium]